MQINLFSVQIQYYPWLKLPFRTPFLSHRHNATLTTTIIPHQNLYNLQIASQGRRRPMLGRGEVPILWWTSSLRSNRRVHRPPCPNFCPYPWFDLMFFSQLHLKSYLIIQSKLYVMSLFIKVLQTCEGKLSLWRNPTSCCVFFPENILHYSYYVR